MNESVFSESDDLTTRTRRLVGDCAVERAAAAHVAVYGLGGVGSYVCEALARGGVGRLTLLDGDRVEPSNLNRQLVALESTIGLPKVEVAASRAKDINSAAKVVPVHAFLTRENVSAHIPEGLDCAVDAIDDVDAKVALLKELRARGVFTVSCMGAANRLDAEGIRVSDIGKTRECPLARTVRQRLRREGIEQGILCVHFVTPRMDACDAARKGSVSFVPPMIGLTAAGVVLRHLWGIA